MNSFDRALLYTLENEGAFTNDPLDRGGATRWGITREEARRWRGRPVSISEMESFPLSEAHDIYLAWYWKPLLLDSVDEESIATAIFDIGVVRGIGSSTRLAQKVCVLRGAHILVDRSMGKLTVASINRISPADFIPPFIDYLKQDFQNIVRKDPEQAHFLIGWFSRADRLSSLLKVA